MKQLCANTFCTNDAKPGSIYCEKHEPKPEPKMHIDKHRENAKEWERRHKGKAK